MEDVENESSLTELWAKILVSVSQNTAQNHLTMISILKKMNGDDARVFNELTSKIDVNNFEDIYQKKSWVINNVLKNLGGYRLSDGPIEETTYLNGNMKHLDKFCIIFLIISYGERSGVLSQNQNDFYKHQNYTKIIESLNNLQSLGLFDLDTIYGSANASSSYPTPYMFQWAQLTSLGLSFLNSVTKLRLK